MKNILIILSMLCFGANADTINLDWYKDGELYDQTTCEIGQDLDLPVIQPSKHGYDFDGWVASFYRGTFENWNEVPTNPSNYYADYNGSSTPNLYDYIIVKDTSNYIKPGEPIVIYDEPMQGAYARARFVVGTNDETFLHTECEGEGRLVGNVGNQIRVKYGSMAWKIIPIDTPLIINGVKKDINEIAYSWGYRRPNMETINKKINFADKDDYVGTWRLRYQDKWSDFGKNGWVTEKYLNGNE